MTTDETTRDVEVWCDDDGRPLLIAYTPESVPATGDDRDDDAPEVPHDGYDDAVARWLR